MPKKYLVTLFFGHRRKHKHRTFPFNLPRLKMETSIFLNNLDPWRKDSSQIRLGKAGKQPLKTKQKSRSIDFSRRQCKYQEF